jgi:multidrug efflux pump subunit AcrA (membrane-fusion protein)
MIAGPAAAVPREEAASGASVATIEKSVAAIEIRDCVVRFAEKVDVPALTSGKVAEVSVAANDAVDAGDPVARLDGATLLIQRRAAQLRQRLAQADVSNDVERQYAKTALAEAQAELDANRSVYQDVAGAVPMTQLRRMRLAVKRGELEVARVEKRRKQSETEVELRNADLSLIDQRIEELRTESPLRGVVLEVTRSAGEWIEQGEPLATIARIERLHIHGLADSHEVAPQDCLAAAVSVHWVDAATGRSRVLRGKVLSVDPQLLPDARYRVRAEIENRLEPGSETVWQLNPGTEVRMKVHATPRRSRAGVAESSQPDWMHR